MAEPAPVKESGASAPRRRRGAGRNLPLAILSGLVLLGAVLGSLVADPLAFVFILAAIAILALVELLTVLRARATKPAAPVVYGIGLFLVFGAYVAGTAALALGLLLALLLGFAWYLLDRDRTEVTRNVAATVFACVYVPFTAAHLSLVAREDVGYVGAIIGYGLTIAAYDTVAYAVGATIGRRRLAPTVSPAKSVEGAIGASVFTIAFGALVLPLWSPWTLASGLTFAIVACVVAPLGDLAESMLKRDLDVKDMGFLLPGHGGFLDRFDALLLAAPILYYVLAFYGEG